MYKRYDLEKTVVDPMIEPLCLGGKGRWLYGKTQQGKTHQQGWLIKTLIETTAKKFTWIRVSITEFFKALENKRHMIPEVQKPAIEFLAKIDSADVIALHDIDKFGNMTASREESFFELLDTCLEQGKLVVATSNFSIADFCTRLTNIEAKLQERDGAGPQRERLKDLCDEIKIVRQR